jgi:hypothetical protein
MPKKQNGKRAPGRPAPPDDPDLGQVSAEERALLEKASDFSESENEEDLKNAVPDNTDLDGEPLNENTSYNDLSAEDLDIPDDFEDDE